MEYRRLQQSPEQQDLYSEFNALIADMGRLNHEASKYARAGHVAAPEDIQRFQEARALINQAIDVLSPKDINERTSTPIQ